MDFRQIFRYGIFCEMKEKEEAAKFCRVFEEFLSL